MSSACLSTVIPLELGVLPEASLRDILGNEMRLSGQDRGKSEENACISETG